MTATPETSLAIASVKSSVRTGATVWAAVTMRPAGWR
jgi:hypothetical protein